MKNLKSLLTAATFALVLLGLSTSVEAAAAVAPAGLLSSTTLNGSISATQTTLVLASASASAGSTFGAPAVGQCVLVDLELMRITAIASTTVTMQRGQRNRAPHLTAAIILTGPCNMFRQVDPPSVVGNNDCTQFVLPWVNVITGDSWWCELATGQLTVGDWSVTNPIRRNGTAGSRRVAQ